MSHTVFYWIGGAAQVIAIICFALAYTLGDRKADEKHHEIIDGQTQITSEISSSIDRALADVSEATTPTGQIAELRTAMGRIGLQGSTTSNLEASSGVDDITSQVMQAIQKIPSDIKQRRQSELDALIEEAEAQQLAVALNREFRPRMAEVQTLVTRILDESEERQLVKIDSRSEMFALPQQVVFTTYAMLANDIPQEIEGNALTVAFTNGPIWEFYLKNGMVKSPDSLASSWDAPTDKYYPMIRLQETIADSSQVLATVWFHQDTKELGIAFNARNTAQVSLRDSIDVLAKETSGEELVSAVLIELLKETRLH